jgi:hypothetical protein
MNRSLPAAFAVALTAVVIAVPAQAAPSYTTRTLIPKVQRTAGFNGYATYVFHAPAGSSVISASARIAGSLGAARIERSFVSRDRKRYTVSLVFPGEQGRPGRLVVRLRVSG